MVIQDALLHLNLGAAVAVLAVAAVQGDTAVVVAILRHEAKAAERKNAILRRRKKIRTRLGLDYALAPSMRSTDIYYVKEAGPT